MTNTPPPPRVGANLLAVPYLRVSTDDKGQDPTRQLITITPWGTGNRVRLTPPVVDEGTSAHKTDPFDRPRFKEAIQLAKTNKAQAILVEQPDRFTRRGGRLYGYYKTKLELEFGLKLWCADRSLENQDTNIGELMEGVQAFAGREKSETLSRRVKEGMAQARLRGVHLGQPKKVLTPLELDLAARLRETHHERKDGSQSRKVLGWDAIAAKISELRFDNKLPVSPDVRRKRSVSGATVRRAFRGRTDWTPKLPAVQPHLEGTTLVQQVVEPAPPPSDLMVKQDKDEEQHPFHDPFFLSEVSA